MVFPPPLAPPPDARSSRPPARYTAGSWAESSSSSSSRSLQPPATRIPVPANPRSLLWVGRLPPDISDADLRATFSPYGHLVRVTVAQPKPGGTTTFAYVAFNTPAEAAAAHTALDGRTPTLLSPSRHPPASSRPTPMRIDFATSDQVRRTSGLFRAPNTPEPSRSNGVNGGGGAASGSGAPVKPEPEPSPRPPRVHDVGPVASTSRAPLPSQAAAAADRAGAARAPPPQRRAQSPLPPRPMQLKEYVQVEDALKILAPTIRFVDEPLAAIGLGMRVLARPSDPASTPPVVYSCTYRLPPSLSADASNPRTIAFARTARDDLALSNIVLASWDVLPERSPTKPALFRTRLVVPPEVVAAASRDTPGQYRKRVKDDAEREAQRAREEAAAGAGAARAGAGAQGGAGGFDDDGALVLRAPLPASCVGAGPDAAKARRAWLGAQARTLAMEGKAVLSTRVDEERGVCEVRYLPLEEEEEDAAEQGECAGEDGGEEEDQVAEGEGEGGAQAREEALAQPRPPPPAATSAQPYSSHGEDVKPVIARAAPAPAPSAASAAPSSSRQLGPGPAQRDDTDVDAEVDQLATPTPEPEGGKAASTARAFPLPILGTSTVDSSSTRAIVDKFLKEYVRRFDESRGTLEYLYTPNALFSLKLDPTVPARHRRATPPLPFEPRWLMAANRLSSTPVAITNAIRALPPGSHDLSHCHYTARTVPELHLRKQQPLAPIVVHLVGEFEEFPDKTLRGFSRTFIIVPRGAGSGTGASASAAGGGAAEYWIHSDQLTMRYHVQCEPRALPVTVPPFDARKASAPLPPRPAAPPRVDSATSSSGAAARPFAQLQPHPALARMQAAAPPPAPVAAAPAPARAPAPVRPARPAAVAAAPPPAPPAAAARPPQQPTQPQKRRRASSASPGPLRPAPLVAASSPDAEEDGDVDMDRDVLVLTDSSAGSRSPTPLPSPVKAAVAPLQRKRRAVSPASRSGPESASTSGSGSKRRVSGPSTTPPSAIAAAEAGLSRAEVERLIQLEVAAQVQRLTANAGRAVSPRSDAEAAEPSGSGSGSRSAAVAAAATAASAASATAGKKRTKERTAERARELLREREREEEAKRAKEKARKDKERKDKERREKEKKDKAEPELGTGLGKTDARILIPGGGNAQLHGFDGRNNKLRHMIDTGSSLLAVSHVGDIVEFSCQTTSLASTVRKLHTSKDDKFRVDDFAWSDTKETLLVGYLGAKDGSTYARPAHQVVLFRREDTPSGTALVPSPLDERPHTVGGVTAIATLPGAGRLRFITGGEDKKLFLWTRSRATQDIKTANIRSEHSSMITSITPIAHQDWFASGGKDKRVFAYDLDRMASTWQVLLHSPVMTVSQVPSDPHLILARVAAPTNQFTIFDIRVSSKSVLQFGYDLAPHTSATGALSPTTMGRYYRGDQVDTVYAFPDYENGVKLWDLRNVRTTLSDRDLKKQHLNGLARSKVVQTMFRGRGELDLLEMAHFSRLSIRG
ncbi:hypothetical protein JCM9279_006490 [Rhodotorula babjevae]